MIMSTTVHFSLVSNPQLLDVVDEQWMQDKLEDDGMLCCFAQLTKPGQLTDREHDLQAMPLRMLRCMSACYKICVLHMQTLLFLKECRRHRLTWTTL